MADNQINIGMAAKDAGVLRLLDQQEKAFGKVLKKLDAVEKESKKGARQVTDDQRKAKRAYEQTLTPLERYEKEIKELNRLKQKGLITNETYNRSIRRQNELLTKSSGGFTNIAKSMGKWVVAGGAVYTMLAQIRREYDNIISRQREARDVQLDVAKEQKAALFNLSEEPGYKKADLIRDVEQIASRGVEGGQGAVYRAASAALSFKGASLSNKDALEAVKVAFQQEYDDPEAAETLATALLSLKKAAPQASFKQIAGQYIASKQTSAIVANDAFAQNFAPGVANLMSFGGTSRENEAILATITQGVNDKEGRVSRNAAINFARQLQLELPGKGSTLERLQYIQSDEGSEIRNRLLGALSEKAREEAGGVPLDSPELKGEAKAYTTLVGMLQGGTEHSKRLQNTLAAIPTLANAEGVFTSKIGEIQSLPIQQNAMLQRVMTSANTNIQANNIIGAKGAIGREGLESILKSVGVSNLGQRLAVARFEAQTNGGRTGSIESAIRAIEGAEYDLTPKPQATVAGRQIHMIPAQSMTSEQRQNIDLLKEVVGLLKMQLKQDKEVKRVKVEGNAGRPAGKPKSSVLSRTP